MAIASINPATGQTVKSFDPLSDGEIDDRLERAASTFASYRLTSFEQRAGWMNAAAGILDAECEDVARTMTSEMGKTIGAARAEVQKCAKACRYYAQHAAEFLADEPADAGAVGARRAYACYQPIGPVLAVMPWNFPLWQAMRFAAPALMAGNVGLLKHASNVPQTALLMEDLFHRAGFPDGAFQTLLVTSDQVERVLRDSRVRAATLTGSEPAGRSVASIAGSEVKKTVLELGGSDAYVVMPSADVQRAAEVGVTARAQNNGQSCIAAKRFIVHEEVADVFQRAFVDRMGALRVGDPMDDATEVGPLATEQGRDDVEELVDDATGKGATVLCGGRRLDGPGWFYPPTVVTGITPEMRMYREEVFGPVAQLYRVRTIDEAIELANATDFGLGSNAWTNDPGEQERFVRDLDAGMVFVNGMTTSYPELPFGGVKHSGYGRELSAHGIREFCNIKSVWVGESDGQTTSARTHAE
jgi:succinate-semialdehyde dehydrogenase/glutarate-semialdehyde dehydrogenase